MEKDETKREVPAYRDKFQLLNKTELALYRKLTEAVPAMLVFSQVSMSQLFHINSFRKDGFLQIATIGRKSVDFLICRQDTSIVLAVEFNGPTHEKAAQKGRDEKKKAALEEAGIPLIVFTPENLPADVQALRRVLAPYVVERKNNEAARNERIRKAKT